MAKSSPSAPAAPDPVATAAAQTTSNLATATAQANLNAVNQVTPYGNLTYTSQPNPNDPSLPQYTATQTLSPDEQSLLTGAQGLEQQGLSAGQGYVNQIVNNSTNANPYSGVTPLNTDYSAMGLQAQQAIQKLEQPTVDQSNEMLNTSLANQGITPGSQAWKYAQDQQANNNNNLTTQAVLAGQTEQQALASQNLAQNQTQFQEVGQQQQMPINELDALLSSSQVQNPTLTSTPTTSVSPTNTSADVYQSYQGNLNNYNSQVASNNATSSGLFGLGGALGAAGLMKYSDRKLKENIRKIGKTKSGFNWYEFNYIGDSGKNCGVIAQEVEKIMPEAIIIGSDGYRRVNYAMVV